MTASNPPFGQSSSTAQHGVSNSSSTIPVDAAYLESLLREMPSRVLKLPPGFTLHVYSADMSLTYSLPSHTVEITRGSIKYVDHYSRYGPQTRFRFQLCHNYLQRKCTKLSECSYIHATVLPKPAEVHLNPFAPRRISRQRSTGGFMQDDPRITDSYERMPGGIYVPILPPPNFSFVSSGIDYPAYTTHGSTPTLVESSRIFRTQGAYEFFIFVYSNATVHSALTNPETAYSILACNDPMVRASLHRVRHCAYFQFKRICNFGPRCQFFHSIDSFVFSNQAMAMHAPQHDMPMMSTAQLQSTSTPPLNFSTDATAANAAIQASVNYESTTLGPLVLLSNRWPLTPSDSTPAAQTPGSPSQFFLQF